MVESRHSSLSWARNVMSMSKSEFMNEVKSQLSNRGRISFNGPECSDIMRTWEAVSKINYLSLISHQDIEKPCQSTSSLLQRNQRIQPLEQSPMSLYRHEETQCDYLETEKFPINVTPLMNEENLWGCFYNFPDLYGDMFSPIVHMRNLGDVPEPVGGVLNRDIISAHLSYLRRIPILCDYVYIKLDLSNKHLVNIDILQHYRYLVYLDLSSNFLTELTVLSHLLYLQFLSVSYNRLSTVLEYETPQWFLTEVHYRYNSVKKIRDLVKFWSITVLDLSHNNIKSINGLENLAYLRHLDLSFNHIQRLENLNHLRLLWLDVSYNNISSFELGPTIGLWTLYHLEYLNLNENSLTSLKLFSGCTRLQELYVRNNRLSILLELAVYMRQLRRLIVLDLRANPICSMPSYNEVVINTFPKLLSLDAIEIDPIQQTHLKTEVAPDVNMFACRRLLRLLYIEQLSRARVSPFVPPADTTDVAIIIIVGYEAVGKGTLARRLAAECSSNIELAMQHTTALYHCLDHYKEVSRSRFDDMLLAGEFLTYTEMDGESYGLSRKEAYIRDGKVRVACMDLTSALMIKLRGRRPYIILATCQDKAAMKHRQLLRKNARNMIFHDKTSIDVPIEKSTLQVLLSGRILVTGILNEIILTLPEEKDRSEFVIASECSLLKDMDARQAVQDYAQEINMLRLLNSSSTSLEDAINKLQNETSLCSLYKESQGTDEYASDMQGQSCTGGQSCTDSKSRSAGNSRTKQSERLSDMTRPKSTEYRMSSAKSSKSVTFTSQDAEATAMLASHKDIAHEDSRKLTGLIIEPEHRDSDENKDVTKQGRSMSKKFPRTMTGHPPPGLTASTCSIDEGDLWLTFLVETGLLQASDPNVQYSDTMPHTEVKIDDPECILQQLAIYRAFPSQTFTTNIRDDYDDIHRKCPGLFWDTITMDDPEAAFKKAKKIIKAIVESQQNLKPMFDIDYAKMAEMCPIIQKKIEKVAHYISEEKYFF